jgi:hypothetical protein
MLCPKCGAEVPDSDYVCGVCGAYARGAKKSHGSESSVTTLDAVPTALDAVPTAGIRLGDIQPQYPRRHPPLGYPTGSGGPKDVYPPMHGWPGVAPPDAIQNDALPRSERRLLEGTPADVDSLPMTQESLDVILAIRAQRAARRWARWSLVLAALALVFPIFFGPIGFASGYIAWRLGEKRLGTIGAALSAAGMIVGIVLAGIVLSLQTQS